MSKVFTKEQEAWCPGQTAKQKAESMRETIRQWPSNIRQAVTDEFEGYLMNAVHATNSCGCRIIGNGSLPLPLIISYCPKHAAVAEMIDTLSLCESLLAQAENDRDLKIIARQNCGKATAQVRAILSKLI